MSTSRALALALVVTCHGHLAMHCGAQDSTAGSSEPPRQPTLDELLGLSPESTAPIAETSTPTDLSQPGEPDAQDPSALMQAALASMRSSATLLEQQHDPGLAAQRSQADTLRHLDALIALAKRNRSQSQQQQQQQQDQQRQSGQQQQQQSASSQSNSDNQGVDARPSLQQSDLSGDIHETGTEWGGLPPRIRDMLLQGRGENASALYRELTERYYRRLAEDASERRQ